MRLFLAVCLGEINFVIEHCRERFQMEKGMKWVKPHQAHLTLKFLGEVADNKLSSVVSDLNDIARRFPPFSLHWDRTGVFPDWNSPQVLWVGIEAKKTPELMAIGRILQGKGFVPHVTVGRVKKGITSESIQGWRMLKLPFEPVSVGKILLVQSKLTPEGPVYSIIAEQLFMGSDISE